MIEPAVFWVLSFVCFFTAFIYILIRERKAKYLLYFVFGALVGLFFDNFQVAMGYYYYQGYLDYERALEHFNRALKDLKDSCDLLKAFASVHRRQGKFNQAVENLRKAFELDPRSPTLPYEIGGTYFQMRIYTKSERYFDQAISLAPDVAAPYAMKARMYICWEGSTKKAHKAIEERLGAQGSKNHFFVLTSVLLEVFDGNYQKALDRLFLFSPDIFKSHYFFVPKA